MNVAWMVWKEAIKWYHVHFPRPCSHGYVIRKGVGGPIPFFVTSVILTLYSTRECQKPVGNLFPSAPLPLPLLPSPLLLSGRQMPDWVVIIVCHVQVFTIGIARISSSSRHRTKGEKRRRNQSRRTQTSSRLGHQTKQGFYECQMEKSANMWKKNKARDGQSIFYSHMWLQSVCTYRCSEQNSWVSLRITDPSV